MTGGLASSWLPHLVQEGKLEWSSPSYRTENTSRAHAGNRRFPCVENSLIPPQIADQFNWPKTGCKVREHAFSLRSMRTYDFKVRLIFASQELCIARRGENLYFR